MRLAVLALLVPAVAFAGWDFDSSVPQYASVASTAVTDEPITMCVGFTPDTDATQMFMMDLRDSTNAALTSALAIMYEGNKTGDPLSCLSVNASTFVILESGTSGCTAGVVCAGCCVFTAHNSRTVYVKPNGGALATASDSTSIVTGAFTRQTLAARYDAASPMNGKLWRMALWSAALTQDEVEAVIADGFLSPCVKRASLKHYYPLLSDFGLRDIFGGLTLATTGGSPTAAPDQTLRIGCR